MKILFLSIFLLIFAFSANSYAQSVVITPKKTTYKRPKPSSDYKKTFIVTRPIVKAATPALSRKIGKAISYETVMKLDIAEEMGELQWLEQASYDVGYNKNGILSISLFVEGSGAYPDGSRKEVVIDIKTGNTVKPADLFTDLAGLAAVIKKRQTKEIAEETAAIKKEPDAADLSPEELFGGSDFKPADLAGFSIVDDGVVFKYEYNFPHVIQAYEPSGAYMFTWTELKPFIKRGGLLERFIR